MTDMPGGATERSEAKDNPCDATASRKALGRMSESGEHMEPGEASRALLTLCRVYTLGVDVFDGNGYPLAWREIKHLVRAAAGNRCLRCGHPYTKGDGEWSRCDEHCKHEGLVRFRSLSTPELGWSLVDLDDVGQTASEAMYDEGPGGGPMLRWEVEAQWRVLTVHHLDGDKANCRWWNLVPLCQRDHLQIQRIVKMDAPWPWTHTDWFKPYAAAFYAFKYLGLDLSREMVERRLDELLALGASEAAIERMPI